MKILIAGDLVPTESNYDLFAQETAEDILGKELAKIWKNADIRIANLEAPIIDGGVPIKKAGPNLSIPERCITGFRSLDFTAFGLSNNHIMDYGSVGLSKTIKHLENAGIKFIGVGENITDANRGLVLESQGRKIGLYACSERESSGAGVDSSGANAIGVNTSLEIYKTKTRCDYLIVLFHGGKEHYPYPSPMQQQRCRGFVEAGADIVVCQHSHCIGCEEEYKGKKIIYGQGNFIFDRDVAEYWGNGLIIEIDIDATMNVSTKLIVIERKKPSIQMTKSQDIVLDEYKNRSRELKTEGAEELYKAMVKQEGLYALRNVMGWSRTKRGIDRFLLSGHIAKKAAKAQGISILGALNCETTVEIVREFINMSIS